MKKNRSVISQESATLLKIYKGNDLSNLARQVSNRKYTHKKQKHRSGRFVYFTPISSQKTLSSGIKKPSFYIFTHYQSEPLLLSSLLLPFRLKMVTYVLKEGRGFFPRGHTELKYLCPARCSEERPEYWQQSAKGPQFLKSPPWNEIKDTIRLLSKIH